MSALCAKKVVDEGGTIVELAQCSDIGHIQSTYLEPTRISPLVNPLQRSFLPETSAITGIVLAISRINKSEVINVPTRPPLNYS
jgi:hypothetical protein